MSEYTWGYPSGTSGAGAASVADGSVDHVAIALSRLPEQLKGKPNIENLLRALIAPIQQLEDALQQLLAERSVNTAVGVQLDNLGFIVGQPRGNVTDDEVYRRYVRAKIMTNRSRGLINDLIRVARLVVYDDDCYFQVRWLSAGVAVLALREIAVTNEVADILAQFLRAATSAGVRIILESATVIPSATFKFDTPGCGFDGPAVFADAR